MKASTFEDANKLDSVNIVSERLSNAPGPDHPYRTRTPAGSLASKERYH